MKEKTIYYCTECGNETGKWFGQCPACGQWNTLTEAPSASQTKSKAGAVKAGDWPSVGDRGTKSSAGSRFMSLSLADAEQRQEKVCILR